MKKVLKAPSDLVRRLLSKTSQTSLDDQRTSKNSFTLMSDQEPHQQQLLAEEIKSLKDQVENLKAVVNILQNSTERKEVAIAELAREKEKISMELLRQQRSNKNLYRQLEEERNFYYKEKEAYCQEMNQCKKLRQSLSSATNFNKEDVTVEQCKKEIAKVKLALNQTLEANYNLSIKFLRMKNTKTCLKTELKTAQLEHEKLVNSYKTKIQDISQQLDNIIQEKLSGPISCSNKKYLQLVKQNSCLVYENLCLQFEVDNLHLKYEKTKLDKSKSDSNSRLKYIKRFDDKNNSKKKSKKVRIKDERPEKLEKDCGETSASYRAIKKENEKVEKIFERHQSPGIPDIHILNDPEQDKSDHQQIVSDFMVTPNCFKEQKILNQPESKLSLFNVSASSSKTATTPSHSSLNRVQSAPEIAEINFQSKLRAFS